MDPTHQRKIKSLEPLLQQLLLYAVLASVLTSALIAGLIIRRFAWDQTEPIRFTEDINNAFRQGSEALRVGYINRYDQDLTGPTLYQSGIRMEFDYAPGRLAVAELWARWVRSKIDGADFESHPISQWDDEFYTRARSLNRQYDLCAPMLRLNITGEILSALAMFLLVRRYTLKRFTWPVLNYSHEPGEVPRPPHSRARAKIGIIAGAVLWCFIIYLFKQCGLPLMFSWQLPALVWLWFEFPANRATLTGIIAVLFFWFNPALIWNAHCWPQWDSWVLPFFLWAILAASCDCWFIAGALIAAGAMFKGQILFGAPVFLLWPIFQSRLLATVRWILGLVTFTTVITAVWLVRTPGFTPSTRFIPGEVNQAAVTWVVCMAAAFGLMIPLLRLHWAWYAKLPVFLFVAALIGYQFSEDGGWHERGIGAGFILLWIGLVAPLLMPNLQPKFKIPSIIGTLIFFAWELLGVTGTRLFVIDVVLIFTCGLATLRTLPRLTRWQEVAIILACPLLAACLLYAGRMPSLVRPCLLAAAMMMSASLLSLASAKISKCAWQIRLPLGWLFTAVIFWPLVRLPHGQLLWAAVAAISTGLLVFYAPRRALPYAASAWVAGCLLLCIPLFNGSSTWFTTGIASPTHHFEAMASGANDNLADILQRQWGWQTMDPAFTIPPGPAADNVSAFLTSIDPKYRHNRRDPVSLPLKYFLISLWIVAVILCAIGAAVHDRRKSLRFLIAMSAPWIAMFALMSQMHQRYLLWGSTLSAAAAALNPGYALLHLLISFIAMSQEMQSMFTKDPPLLQNQVGMLLRGWHPGIGWAVVLTAIIFVYTAARPIRSRNAS